MSNLRLFALAVQERTLLQTTISMVVELELTMAKGVRLTTSEVERLAGIRDYLGRGGFGAYAGSVTDQDGDSSWQITSSIREIRKWADYMARVSYETPRIYQISIERTGFGVERRLRHRTPSQVEFQGRL